MARGVVGRSLTSATRPHFNSEIATAQILADFQYKRLVHPAASPCTDDCRPPVLQSCSEECEIPCTSECTDQCVVVCEEPHGVDEDLCCDLQNPCDNSDCQYAYLDDSCCMGCPSDPPEFATSQRASLFVEDTFALESVLHYQQQQQFMNSHLDIQDQAYFQHGSIGQSNQSFRPSCFSNPGFSHCAFPCAVNSANTYEDSHIPSLIASAGKSPWSLQSSLSGSSDMQFSPTTEVESSNSLSILANYSTTDMTFIQPSTPFSDPSKFTQRHRPSHSIDDVSAIDLAIDEATFTSSKIGGAGNFWLSAPTHVFPKMDDETDAKSTFDLSCRWLLADNNDSRLCGCVFKTRDELHRHIIEDHVKTIKKAALPAVQAVPVCRWQGCESAKRKKMFKLQHLKDHIVCHSKLRMKCEICGKECRDSKVLKLHMNTHRPGQEKPFHCDVEGCTASFGTSALLSSHKRVHTGEKPHKCAWCSYRAADKGNLRRHEEEMHMGKKWPCPYCSQKLAKKANLTRHIRDLHANEQQQQARSKALSLFSSHS